MYALKLITVRNGRHVEEVYVLGSMYRLEMSHDNEIAAYIEHDDGHGNTPCFTVLRTDEAYITTITGETVRHVSRGNLAERDKLALRQHTVQPCVPDRSTEARSDELVLESMQ